MDNSPSTASLLALLEQFSGRKLRRQDLSFHAKFVSNVYRILKRIGPGANGFDKLSQEFNAGIEKVSALIRVLITHATPSLQERFQSTYLTLSPDTLENLLALCYDLSWYKNWLLEHNATMHRRTHVATPYSGVTWRIALVVLLIAGILWLGGATIRSIN
jgi:hypothetical protein